MSLRDYKLPSLKDKHEAKLGESETFEKIPKKKGRLIKKNKKNE